VEPPPSEYIYLEKSYKTDQTSAVQADIQLKNVVEFIFPYFKEYKKWAITDSIEIPEGYSVHHVTVTVNHGSNGVSFPTFNYVPAPILNAAILTPLMMPSIQYNQDSSAVLVNVGSESQKSSYFFFDSEEMLDSLFGSMQNMPTELAAITTELNTAVQTFRQKFMSYFTSTFPNKSKNIVEDQIDVLSNKLNTFINSVQGLFTASVDLNPFDSDGWTGVDWEKFGKALTAQQNTILDSLTPPNLTSEFTDLADDVDSDVLQPFLDIYNTSLASIVSLISDSTTNPLQEFAEIFESSENLYFQKSHGAEGKLPISLNMISSNPGVTVNVVIRLRRSERAVKKWELETYEKLYQGYLRLKEEYESQLYYQSGPSYQRLNSKILRKKERAELKKRSVKALIQHHSEAQHAQLNSRTLDFFEHAIEWDKIAHKFSNYGLSYDDIDLRKLNLLDSADEVHEAFLKAVKAYVILPVRVEYTKAMLGYLENGKIEDIDLEDEEAIQLYYSIFFGNEELQNKPKPVGEPRQIVQPTKNLSRNNFVLLQMNSQGCIAWFDNIVPVGTDLASDQV
jgi:hypothetical protein